MACSQHFLRTNVVDHCFTLEDTCTPSAILDLCECGPNIPCIHRIVFEWRAGQPSEVKCDQTHNQQSQGTSSHWIGWNEWRFPKYLKHTVEHLAQTHRCSWGRLIELTSATWFTGMIIMHLLNVVFWCLPQMRDCVPYHPLWHGTWTATLPWPQSNSNRYSL